MKTTRGIAFLALALGALFLPLAQARADHQYQREQERKRRERQLEQTAEALTEDAYVLQAQNRRLRRALDKAGEDLAHAANDIQGLRNTLNALDARLQPRKAMGVGSDPVINAVKKSMLALQRLYGDALVSLGKTSVRPLLTLLQESPARGMPWIAPLFVRIGLGAAQAVPYLKRIVADKRHQQGGVARLAEKALAKIAPANSAPK